MQKDIISQEKRKNKAKNLVGNCLFAIFATA